ncbi:MAG TPA: LysR family transcriptional regulator [Candidatus Limnocylindrales bacterium]|jgi:DNA-binding transcriptional LysR family regulator|nr:LysR family transcriptional regulator [Candidatus Limnocylindrales bacterium]
MEVHQLRYFCAIVKYGTFTRAASEEHVSQPSLSQQIIKLEDELGGKLFNRLPRSSRLTALGEIFLPRALTVLKEIRDCKAEAQRIVALQQAEPAPIPQGIKPCPGALPAIALAPTSTVSPANSRADALSKSA